MSAAEYLFGFTGRINRAKWWLFILIQLGVGVLYYAVVWMLVGAAMVPALVSGSTAALVTAFGGLTVFLFMLTAILWIGLFIASLAVGVKRLHDRDKSGHWLWLFILGPWFATLLIVLAAIIHSSVLTTLFFLVWAGISIWAFIELGCLRGTLGPNRYGPDPLPMGYYNPAYNPAQPYGQQPYAQQPMAGTPQQRAPAYGGAQQAARAPSSDNDLPNTSGRRAAHVQHDNLELTGTGEFAQYYLRIDASELGDMTNGLLIGRDANVCTLAIDHNSVSRRHARVSFRDGKYFLEDMDSTNGTRVDAKPVNPNRSEPLKTGNTVSFGTATFSVQILPADN